METLALEPQQTNSEAVLAVLSEKAKTGFESGVSSLRVGASQLRRES